MNSATKIQYPSTAHLQKMFDLSPDVICTVDEEGMFVDVSRASLQVWGYRPDELIGKCYTDFIVEEDYQKTKKAAYKCIQGAVEINFENRYYHKTGSIVPISWSAKWDPQEKLLFCIARDDSERKAKEILIQAQFEQMVPRPNLDMNEMLELITDGFFAMDKESLITHITPRVENIVPIKREDYLYKNIWECFPEMINSTFYEHFNKALAIKKPVHFIGYFTPFEKWIEVDAYPSHTGLSVFFRDITSQKKEEEELRRLSLVAEHTNNIVAISSSDHKILWVNDAFTRITGHTFEEVKGKMVGEIFDGPQTAPETISFVNEKLNNHESVQVEAINYKKNGDTYWADISCHPIFDEHGQLKQFFSIATDITERKKAEEEMSKLALIIKQTDNLVLLCDQEGMIKWANDAFIQKTGYAQDEIIGQSPVNLLSGPETDLKAIEYLRSKYRKGEPFHLEVLSYTKNKEKFWIENTCQAVLDAHGEVKELFSIMTDVTERKLLEEKLELEREIRQRKIAAAVIQAQEREQAHVSRELHDNVNQVLTTVKLYAELCRDGIGDTKAMLDKTRHLLQECIDEIRSLSKRLSAPSLGNIKLKESIKDLVDTVAVTNKISVSLDAYGIEGLEVDQKVHLALYRILQEQLTNILRHAQATEVQITVDFFDGALCLQVTDNGKGFDPKQKREGIGLTNMIFRAENLGGTLTITSAPAKGCKLMAHIPLES